jgi:hypothetical protein
VPGLIEQQCTQGTDQPPQNDCAAADESPQTQHQQEGEQQYQQELAETKEMIATRQAEVDDAEQ